MNAVQTLPSRDLATDFLPSPFPFGEGSPDMADDGSFLETEKAPRFLDVAQESRLSCRDSSGLPGSFRGPMEILLRMKTLDIENSQDVHRALCILEAVEYAARVSLSGVPAGGSVLDEFSMRLATLRANEGVCFDLAFSSLRSCLRLLPEVAQISIFGMEKYGCGGYGSEGTLAAFGARLQGGSPCPALSSTRPTI